ncbi:MAG: efflux RND transporter periplasmic adaptor subunit, partial [Noviherbaspirillum sp.]
LRLRQTQVVAPDNGVISARSATVGAVVPAGTELFRMVRQGRLEWRAEVTSVELGRLRTGATVLVTAANGTELKGRIRMFAPTVNPQTRSALVYVDLPSQSDKTSPAKAGMFATGEFDLGSSNALTVQQQAVVVRDGFSYVFRVNADNRVSQIKVQTGRRLADRVELLDGIKPDTALVVSGAGFLNDGDLVKVVQEAMPQANAGTSPTAK